eukprot:364496-Chlamydomonas_euryale.AAC.54
MWGHCRVCQGSKCTNATVPYPWLSPNCSMRFNDEIAVTSTTRASCSSQLASSMRATHLCPHCVMPTHPLPAGPAAPPARPATARVLGHTLAPTPQHPHLPSHTHLCQQRLPPGQPPRECWATLEHCPREAAAFGRRYIAYSEPRIRLAAVAGASWRLYIYGRRMRGRQGLSSGSKRSVDGGALGIGMLRLGFVCMPGLASRRWNTHMC